MKGLFSRARTASGAPSDENRTGSLTNSEKKMKGKNYGKQKKKYSDALLGYIRRKEVDP